MKHMVNSGYYMSCVVLIQEIKEIAMGWIHISDKRQKIQKYFGGEIPCKVSIHKTTQ
jgi:hypothetical protein